MLDGANIGTPNASEMKASVKSIEEQPKQTLGEQWVKAKQNFSMTDGLLYALVYVFVLTFICYPGLTTDDTIDYLTSLKSYDSWHILVTQAVFNAFDTIGRYSGGVSCLMLSNRSIKICSALRTVFLVTFLLVAFDVAPTVVFSADWFIMINLALFSITNGYISTLCAVKAPSTVEGENIGQVGSFIGITVSTGIVIGSILAFGMTQVIKHSPEYDA